MLWFGDLHQRSPYYRVKEELKLHTLIIVLISAPLALNFPPSKYFLFFPLWLWLQFDRDKYTRFML